MNTSELISAIDSELATLRQVRALLAGNNGTIRTVKGARQRRTMRAEARARIAAAQKKRWAAWKRAKKAA